MPEQQTVNLEITDEELIIEFQAGKVTAFNVLVGRYKDELMNFAFRYLGNYDEADDVVQETFIRVYRSKSSYKPIAKFSTWLYTIAINLAKTQLKRRKRFSIFSFRRTIENSEEKETDIPDNNDPSPEQYADSSIKQEMVQKAINSLNIKYKEIVILYEIQELSYEEICKITGLKIGTVKSRLNRARSKLHTLLKDQRF